MKVLSRAFLISMSLIAFFSTAQASDVYASGEFSGRNDHITSGGFNIITTNGQTLLVLEEEFFLDGAPDPKIGFGNNGFVSSTLIAELGENTGAQVYVIPSSINVSEFNEVYIWCEKFDIALGVASYSS